MLPGAFRNYTCTGERLQEPMWRFGAFQYYVLTQTAAGGGDDESWLEQIPQFTGPVLVVAGICGAGRADFQREHTMPVLPGAKLESIAGAGHITLLVDYSGQTLQRIRNALLAYR